MEKIASFKVSNRDESVLYLCELTNNPVLITLKTEKKTALVSKRALVYLQPEPVEQPTGDSIHAFVLAHRATKRTRKLSFHEWFVEMEQTRVRL